MENKKSFVLYCDIIHTISKLPDKDAGKLFKHILSYVNDENPTTDNLILEVAFEPIRQSLKRDLNKWKHSQIKRSEAGKKGALAKHSNARHSQKDVSKLDCKGKGNGNSNGNSNKKEIGEISMMRTKGEFFLNENVNSAFKEFIDHRRLLKRPMTDLAIKKMRNRVLAIEPEKAIAMLNQSIENGWIGIFEDKNKTNGKTRAEQALENISIGGNENLNQITGLGSF